jgi:predicted nucleotidyltransferase
MRIGGRLSRIAVATSVDQELFSKLAQVLGADERVVLAYVFGSAGRGEAAPTSDVDVAIWAKRQLDLSELSLFAESLARAIEFCRRIDVIDLRLASPVLAAEVIRDGVPLVVRSAEARFDFETAAIRKFEDTKPLRRVQHDLLREGRGHS